MIKPEMVPKEAIAELRAFLNSCDCDDCVAVAIAAALNAWPGKDIVGYGPPFYGIDLILPLAAPSGAIMENPDDKA